MVFTNAYKDARDAFSSFSGNNIQEKKRLLLMLIDSMKTNDEIQDFGKALKEFDEYRIQMNRTPNIDP